MYIYIYIYIYASAVASVVRVCSRSLSVPDEGGSPKFSGQDPLRLRGLFLLCYVVLSCLTIRELYFTSIVNIMCAILRYGGMVGCFTVWYGTVGCGMVRGLCAGQAPPTS